MEQRDELEMYATAYSLCIVSTSIVQILNKEQGLERRSALRVLSNHSVYLLMQDSLKGKINQHDEKSAPCIHFNSPVTKLSLR